MALLAIIIYINCCLYGLYCSLIEGHYNSNRPQEKFELLGFFFFSFAWWVFMLTSALSAPVGCPRPSDVPHGRGNLTETNRGSFPVGTLLQYSCDPGYTLDGYSIITCTVSGHWSSDPPRCIKNDGMFNLFVPWSCSVFNSMKVNAVFRSCWNYEFQSCKLIWKLWFLSVTLTLKLFFQ